MKNTSIGLLFVLLGLSQGLSAQNYPQLGQSTVKEVIGAMTTEEKAKLLVGMGFAANIPGLPPLDPEDMKIPEKVPGAAGRTHAIARLGIPSLTLSDGPAGVRINPIRNKDSTRTYYATAFPVATLLASTWDPALITKVGEAFGSEVKEYGIDILLAPGMNIQRNPLGGRNFEYYAEDPVIAGNMAAAFTKGIQSNGVGVSVKHFAANNQEFNRMKMNTHVSQRALREIYLRGFQIAVEKGNPWTVMSSYNYINGVYTSQSKDLLTTILRNEWGFKGFVMTDWFGGDNPVAQMAAGNDVIMPGNPDHTRAIIKAVEDGALSQADLDANVERVLDIILESPTFKAYEYSNQPNLEADAQVSHMAAAEGMVLLKNEGNALPLASEAKVAMFGNTSYELIVGGTGSGDVYEAYSISPAKGLFDAGFKVNPSVRGAYEQYLVTEKAKQPKQQFSFFLPPPIPEMTMPTGAIAQHASFSDVAVITIGRNSGEFSDRKVENDFNLTTEEHELIKTVADAFHAKGKKVIVVLNIGGVIEVASWRDQVDAILLAWQPGQEGGRAIADVMSGKVNPSGKLAITFPVSYQDVPSAKTFPGKELPSSEEGGRGIFGKPSEVTYEEGIYVGYRYYNTFGVKPAYEFGYGKSYTSFEYGKIKLGSKKFEGSITATLKVTNKGKVAGKEVVQLYLGAPSVNMDKPTRELKGFAKTALLQPGQSETVTFTLMPADLASFNTTASSWVADAGVYSVEIGASSEDIRQITKFTLPAELVVAKVNDVLKPQRSIDELKPMRK